MYPVSTVRQVVPEHRDVVGVVMEERQEECTPHGEDNTIAVIHGDYRAKIAQDLL
ncbi:hypothetical protein POX_h09463 [Penicillium oxalicum]|uniref:Uncharacterized protein n=1 Tax=Penicillium oxalicum (strain 114-2 / CGMCC 5302) TaxID=933388 RepID=S7ZLF7_PENO1|nr:hypothetical protein POX_h09463 [Penicillium oxalicum]EPS31164.1 hypothetical protein PDE_06119 [Penicillium oxalicum 114-2]KAI2785705.1 hypothetical protein POX_h09463 [Penicillium oxalicum]